MDVSILISLHNRLDFTRACLESLGRTIGRVRHEVILVDDGSTDGTRDFLRSLPQPRYRILRNERPRGYAASIDAAAQLARGTVLCLLHNDTVLMPGWLGPMLRLLRRSTDVGCVGNVQREPFSGLIDHIGVRLDSSGLPTHAGRDDFAAPRSDYGRWAAVSTACCLVRKDVFASLGGFDEGFDSRFAGADFCLRAADAGYRHYVANRSVIYHHIGASPDWRAGERTSVDRYRARWGARFLAFASQRELGRSEWQQTHLFSPENESAWREQWELGRETRRQRRQDIVDARLDGRRYLRKHLVRPWRYNLGRVCRALAQAAHPLPAAIPPPPRIPSPAASTGATNGAPAKSAKDSDIFDPPQQ
jgi:GT2 family glycosyltransferase